MLRERDLDIAQLPAERRQKAKRPRRERRFYGEVLKLVDRAVSAVPGEA
jgi:hypothetical protein